MNNEYETINFTIYNPKTSIFKISRNDKAECTIYYCKNKDNCDLYKRNQCHNINIFSDKCPYGYTNRKIGYTQKARKYNSWINEKKEKYKDICYKLKSASKKMCVVGDFIYLPYSFMNKNTMIPFEKHSSFMISGSSFLISEYFNIKNIISIINFKPQAMMGGEINDYQEKEVPKFVIHLKEVFPDLFLELSNIEPKILEIEKKFTNVGRKALLSSLSEGTIIHKKEERWVWDGTNLISSNTKLLFPIVNYDEIMIQLKPKKEETIIIVNDNQVDEDTIFID